jgi:uncharacterized RDD family membrane protein YckC
MSPRDPIRRIAEAVVPRAIDLLPVDEVLAEIDIDQLLARIDMNALLVRVDIDALLRNIDLDALLARIDVDDLVQRVEVDRLVERLNIAELIKRAQVDAIVAATASGLGNRLLDLIRRQLVGVDILVTRLVDRTLHRQVEEPIFRDGSVTGQVAGGATRLFAFFVDLGLLFLAYSVAVAVIFFLASIFVGHNISAYKGKSVWQIVIFVAFILLYQWISLVIAGRTIGRAIAGLRVTSPDGSPVNPIVATRRVIVYPFSFILGLGLIGIVTGRNHRALHDIAAPTLVRYDWGDRPAMMPAPLTDFLERSGVTVQGEGLAAAGELLAGDPSTP